MPATLTKKLVMMPGNDGKACLRNEFRLMYVSAPVECHRFNLTSLASLLGTPKEWAHSFGRALLVTRAEMITGLAQARGESLCASIAAARLRRGLREFWTCRWKPGHVEVNTQLSGNADLTQCTTVSQCDVRPSRLTSRVIVANSTLTDIPHIKTPMMLSSGPSMRQFDGRTTSP
jgi:hypothetical protein